MLHLPTLVIVRPTIEKVGAARCRSMPKRVGVELVDIQPGHSSSQDVEGSVGKSCEAHCDYARTLHIIVCL